MKKKIRWFRVQIVFTKEFKGHMTKIESMKIFLVCYKICVQHKASQTMFYGMPYKSQSLDDSKVNS